MLPLIVDQLRRSEHLNKKSSRMAGNRMPISTPRQHRVYDYTPHLPQSSSCIGFDNPYPPPEYSLRQDGLHHYPVYGTENFYQRIAQCSQQTEPTPEDEDVLEDNECVDDDHDKPLISHRSQVTKQGFPVNTHIKHHQNQVAPSLSRCATDGNFPGPRKLHSNPTVAKSRLTASVSTHELSQPTPRRRILPGLSPTRIPSPISAPQKHRRSQHRHASTPVLPTPKGRKENMQPKTMRLLGVVSPSENQPTMLPKSRTLGMLSSLTATFSRSNLNVANTRQTSYPLSHSEATVASTTTSPPQALFTTDSRRIQAAQPNAYWCGRFQSVDDRFCDEYFQNALYQPETMKQYVTVTTPSPRSKRKNKKSKKDDVKLQTATQTTVATMMEEDEDKRQVRVFELLDSLCITTEAKRSLWEWQLAYARIKGVEALLPAGGRMRGDRNGLLGRMGRVFSSGNSLGPNLSTSRNALGNRGESALGMISECEKNEENE